MQGSHVTITLPASTTFSPQGLESFLNVNGHHGTHFDFFFDAGRKSKVGVEVASDRLDVDITQIRDDVENLIKEFQAQERSATNTARERRRGQDREHRVVFADGTEGSLTQAEWRDRNKADGIRRLDDDGEPIENEVEPAPAEEFGTQTDEEIPAAGEEVEARGVATPAEDVNRPEVLDLPAEAREEIDPEGEAERDGNEVPTADGLRETGEPVQEEEEEAPEQRRQTKATRKSRS